VAGFVTPTGGFFGLILFSVFLISLLLVVDLVGSLDGGFLLLLVFLKWMFLEFGTFFNYSSY
jgi:hypothetical protein